MRYPVVHVVGSLKTARITDLEPVADIVRRTWTGAEAALQAARGRISAPDQARITTGPSAS